MDFLKGTLFIISVAMSFAGAFYECADARIFLSPIICNFSSRKFHRWGCEKASINPLCFDCKDSSIDNPHNRYQSFAVMSASTVPSAQTIAAIKTSIQNTMKAELPQDMLANAVAPFLTTVNQLASQVTSLVETPGNAALVNNIFSIRNEIYAAPRYIHSAFGIPLSELPAPFHEFGTFIHKLIEAQKAEKDKNASKVTIQSLISSTVAGAH